MDFCLELHLYDVLFSVVKQSLTVLNLEEEFEINLDHFAMLKRITFMPVNLINDRIVAI